MALLAVAANFYLAEAAFNVHAHHDAFALAFDAPLPCKSGPQARARRNHCALTAQWITLGRSRRERSMPTDNRANENRRPQPWWAKLLEKVGLGSFVKR